MAALGNNFLTIAFGNEDKWEETDIMEFDTPKQVSSYLRKVADRIEKYESSKHYRASEEMVLADDQEERTV